MESFIGWIGGKRLLRKVILERFPSDEVGRYIEVFGGAAWVLFAKERQKNQMEVYNDLDGNLVNLFRCVKYHCGELQRELEWMLTAREQFFDCLEQVDMRGLTDIQRAALFYLDPPYVGSERYYKSPFKPEDHQRLKAALSGLKGRFILSYNDDPLVRELYSGCRIESISRNQTLAGNNDNRQQFSEVIIRNY